MTIPDCTHPKLIHVVNHEYGGELSTTYKCEHCHQLLTVRITPLTITVTFPHEVTATTSTTGEGKECGS